jgi:hypothetical protein
MLANARRLRALEAGLSEHILSQVPLGRSRFFRLLGASLFAAAIEVAVPRPVSAACPPYPCFGCCSCSCCTGASCCASGCAGHVGSCYGGQCWYVCGSGATWYCCDYDDPAVGLCCCSTFIRPSCG